MFVPIWLCICQTTTKWRTTTTETTTTTKTTTTTTSTTTTNDFIYEASHIRLDQTVSHIKVLFPPDPQPLLNPPPSLLIPNPPSPAFLPSPHRISLFSYCNPTALRCYQNCAKSLWNHSFQWRLCYVTVSCSLSFYAKNTLTLNTYWIGYMTCFLFSIFDWLIDSLAEVSLTFFTVCRRNWILLRVKH